MHMHICGCGMHLFDSDLKAELEGREREAAANREEGKQFALCMCGMMHA
jgi:hypothetical protein